MVGGLKAPRLSHYHGAAGCGFPSFSRVRRHAGSASCPNIASLVFEGSTCPASPDSPSRRNAPLDFPSLQYGGINVALDGRPPLWAIEWLARLVEPHALRQPAGPTASTVRRRAFGRRREHWPFLFGTSRHGAVPVLVAQIDRFDPSHDVDYFIPRLEGDVRGFCEQSEYLSCPTNMTRMTRIAERHTFGAARRCFCCWCMKHCNP